MSKNSLKLPVAALISTGSLNLGAYDKIYIPRSVEGKPGNVVIEVANHEANVKIFWHLDQQFIGTTSYIHQKALNPGVGQHLITLTDEHGNTMKRLFTILNSTEK